MRQIIGHTFLTCVHIVDPDARSAIDSGDFSLKNFTREEKGKPTTKRCDIVKYV